MHDLLISSRHAFTNVSTAMSFAGLTLPGETPRMVLLDPSDARHSLVVFTQEQLPQLQIFYHWIGALAQHLCGRAEPQIFRVHWNLYLETVEERNRHFFGELLHRHFREADRSEETIAFEHIAGPRLENWQVLIDTILEGRLQALFLKDDKIPQLVPDKDTVAKTVPAYLPHPGMLPVHSGEADMLEMKDRLDWNQQRNLHPTVM